MVDAAQRRETREFFASRAATWDERFPDDGPAFAAAVAALSRRPGDAAVDLGCGTGRAVPRAFRATGSEVDRPTRSDSSSSPTLTARQVA